VVVEALDVDEMARFWAAALGWESSTDGAEVSVRPADPDGVALLFVPSSRPKAGKNRLHLDLADGGDQTGEVSRLLALGASPADIGQGGVPWVVLADPEGNEFCVLPRPGPAGRLSQICLDAADPDVQGPFWAAATGWAVTERAAWGVRLHPGPSRSHHCPDLVMGPPATARSGPNRLRFRLAPVTGAPVTAETAESAETARLLSLGAVRSPVAHLLADPEGNEFELGQ